MIKVALVDKHPVVCDALEALLSGMDDIEIVGSRSSMNELYLMVNEQPVHVALVVLYQPDPNDAVHIKILSDRFPKVKVLVLSMYRNEEFILKLIKAGAKGHLSRETDRSEIMEAIYTLRNGYEFYAKTITNILLSSYLSDKDIDLKEKENRQVYKRPHCGNPQE
ncbi:MAG: response regulator transcription factor [bacterium]